MKKSVLSTIFMVIMVFLVLPINETTAASVGYTNSEILAIQNAFDNTSGDIDGVNGQQCTDFSYWFVKTYTTLTSVSANGNITAERIASRNGLPAPTSEPQGVAVFSVASKTKQWGASGTSSAGHTGIVLSIDTSAKKATVLHTASGWSNPKAQMKTYPYPCDGVTFTYIGGHLKNTPVHTHVYNDLRFETTHPHREYMRCSCTEFGSFTGTYAYVPTCADCNVHTHVFDDLRFETTHPHREYMRCSCTEFGSFTGTYAYVPSCADCNVHTHVFNDLRFETSHPHREYMRCSCTE